MLKKTKKGGEFNSHWGGGEVVFKKYIFIKQIFGGVSYPPCARRTSASLRGGRACREQAEPAHGRTCRRRPDRPPPFYKGGGWVNKFLFYNHSSLPIFYEVAQKKGCSIIE